MDSLAPWPLRPLESAAGAAGLFGVAIAAKAAAIGMSALGIAVSVVGFFTSPIGLLTAAVVGLGAVAFRASGGFKGLSETFSEVKETAMSAFQGIKDALAEGNFQLAGQIAMTGLKLAVLQGMEALKGIVGVGVVGIAGKFVNGDISGAWTDTIKHLSKLWVAFSEGLVNTINSAAKEVIKVWAKATTFISDKLLALASLPGFNKAFEVVSGVDVRAEIARGKRLGIEDPLGDTQKIAAEALAKQADEMIAHLDAVQIQAAQETREAYEEASEAATEGAKAVSSQVEILARQLANLKGRSKADPRQRRRRPGGTLGKSP